MKKTLIIVAHPNIEYSENNKVLRDVALGCEGVTVHELYALYPTFKIDVAKEQELLLSHDAIIFQFPLYWYSSPSLLKEWQDVVLLYGFAYGEGGDKLKGKDLAVVITAGGPKDAYRAEGYNHFTIEEFLRPFEQTANLCQMNWGKHFVIHSSKRISPEERDVHAADYRRFIEGTVSGHR